MYVGQGTYDEEQRKLLDWVIETYGSKSTAEIVAAIRQAMVEKRVSNIHSAISRFDQKRLGVMLGHTRLIGGELYRFEII